MPERFVRETVERYKDMNTGWEYYNHALVPTTPPHVEPDTSWMSNRKKWKELAGDRFAVLARWTTDFDCGYETNWWFVVKDAPFCYEKLDKNDRKHVRQSLRKCTVKRIFAYECVDDLFRVYEEAYERYANADNKISYNQFYKDCMESDSNLEYWGGYDLDGRMIGYMTAEVHEAYVLISMAKFSARYMNSKVSNALYYTVLDYYLNKIGKRYVSSGERSINHITNTQDYKIRTFGYRKAYCRLHIKYNPSIAWLIKILYPMRNFIKIFEKNTFVHQVMGVLRMEEINRSYP